MSKVALRVYNRDIEALIDQGHIDEAVAHCLYILKSFPKHLETYRLMGKAYLEAHRYTDAADIFQRVLLAAPDDFVSQLGMSIVCDEQGDLNGAIWHMERAFEVTPTNASVQGELRRLYGRRDGLEPPKIHLTRGALAQIYTRGGEYQQAISEIKSLLAEDGTRTDMKTLLARTYFRAGMKNEAVEVCIELLRQYPYSLDGNRIMMDILPGTSMAQGVEQYRRRIRSLDPYAAEAAGSVFETKAVPDDAVMIDRLDWDASAAPAADGNWQMPAPTSAPTAAPAAQAEEIPTWMKQSGWGPSSGTFQEGPLNLDEPDEPAAPAAGAPLAAADIPDWLKAMAPPGATQPDAASTKKEDAADFDWLDSLGGPAATTPQPGSVEKPATPQQAPKPATSSDAMPDWLADLGGSAAPAWLTDAAATEPASAIPGNQPLQMSDRPTMPVPEPSAQDDSDWLANLTAKSAGEPASGQPAATETGLPDWLSQLGGTETPAAVEPPVAVPQAKIPAAAPPVAPAAEQPDVSMPDWLSQLGGTETPAAAQPQQPAQEDNIPDWLSSLGGPETPAAVEPPAAMPAAEQPDESMPDWLSQLGGTETPAAAAAQPRQPAQEDNIPDWLSSLGGPETPAAVEQPAATPQTKIPAAMPAAEQPDESMPDWLSQLGGTETPAAAAQPRQPAQEDNIPDWLSSLGGPETPAAVEPPAAMHQAKIPTAAPPAAPAAEQPDESMPDWLSQLGRTETPAAVSAAAQPGQPPAVEEGIPDWLSGLTAPEAPDFSTPVSASPSAQPAAESAPAVPSQAAAPVEPALQAAPAAAQAADENVPDWLRGLGQAEPASEQPATEEGLPDWMRAPDVAQAGQAPETGSENAPDWLSGLTGEAKPAGEKPETAETRPNWLTGAAENQPGSGATEAADLPAWLSDLSPSTPASGELPPAWLGDQPAPTASQPSTENIPGWLSDVSTPEPGQPTQENIPDWLSNLGAPAPAAGQSAPETGPDWMSEKPGAEPAAADAGLPDWLSDLSAPETAPQPAAGDVPGWLSGQPEEQLPARPQEQGAATQPPAAPVGEAAAIPGELSALVSGPGTSSSEQDEALRWLESLAEKQGAKPEELLNKPEDRQESIPDWVTNSTTQPAPEATQPPAAPVSEAAVIPGELSALVSGPGTSSSEQDEALRWLESLAEKQGAKPEELINKPEDRQESIPDWVTGSTAQPAAPVSDELSALVSGPGTSSSEQDEALRWLESLAEKQGAKPEELINKPEDRQESVPDWVTNSAAQPAPEAVQPPAVPAAPVGEAAAIPGELSALVSGPGTSSSEQDEALRWLESLAEKQGAKPEELLNKPEDRQESVPDWVTSSAAQPAPEAAQPPAVPAAPAGDELSALVSGPGTSSSEQDEALRWLESLAEKQGAKPEELLNKPEDRQESIPDWVTNSAAQPAPEAAQPPAVPAAPAGDELSALVSGPGTSSSEQDEALRWLESLAEKQGAKPEELLNKPEDRQESVPDWVTGSAAQPAPEATQPPAAMPAMPAGDELSALVTGPGTSSSEQDEALRWLESLAEKQGAKPEELINKPEDRQESIPDWVTGSAVQPAPEATQPPAVPAGDELSALVTGPGTSSSEQDEALRWLESLAEKQGAKPEELINKPEDRQESVPDWVTGSAVQPAPEATQPPAAPASDELSALVSGPGTSSSEQDEALRWLESLAEKQGAKPEELLNKPEDRQESVPDWVTNSAAQPATEVTQPPAALAGDELSALVSGPGTSSSEQDEALRWLESLAEKQGAKPEELINKPEDRQESVPDWVTGSAIQSAPEATQPPAALGDTQPTRVVAETASAAPQAAQELRVASAGFAEAAAAAAEAAQAPQAQEEHRTASAGFAEAAAAAGEFDWLGDLGAPVEKAATSAPATLPDAPDTSFDWLPADQDEGPVNPQGTPWEPVVPQDEARPVEAAAVPAEDIPDWLAGLSQEPTAKSGEPVVPQDEARPVEAAAVPAEDIPDWLAGFGQEPAAKSGEPAAPQDEAGPVEAAAVPAEDIPDWLAGLGQEPAAKSGEPQAWEQAAASASAAETAASSEKSEMADWLDSLAEAESAKAEEPLPWDARQPTVETPAAPDESAAWLNSLAEAEGAQPKASEEEELPDWLKESSREQEPTGRAVPEFNPAASMDQPEAGETQPDAEAAEEDLFPASQPAPVGTSQRPSLAGSDKDMLAIQKARDFLNHGGLGSAMSEYIKLIKKGKLLEDVIYDLQEAVYSHPVDVIVWQTLGDAYMRLNRLQEALDAYSKAEQLLR